MSIVPPKSFLSLRRLLPISGAASGLSLALADPQIVSAIAVLLYSLSGLVLGYALTKFPILISLFSKD